VNTNLGVGSGVIFETDASDRSALLLTNYHVIEGASQVTVVVNDEETYAGIILGVDDVRDLAVVRICCSVNFRALTFGDVSLVKVGSEVIAIGYALGLGGPATVTRGIVSAIRYDEDAARSVIQTDASINPGNSGGPLLSMNGEILGINTFIVRDVGAGVPIEGFGFAVSETTVRLVLPTLTVEGATPPPSSGATERWYTSEQYWYSIKVPAGWDFDDSEPDNLAIWDPKSGAFVWVLVEEIDPSVYPTLDSYLMDWTPSPFGTDYEVIVERRITTGRPVQAQEFISEFRYEGTKYERMVHWYVCGRFQFSVFSMGESMWAESAEILRTLDEIVYSFQPWSYVSDDYGYSLAHPPDWTVEEVEGYDYYAHDSATDTEAYVWVAMASGYPTIQAYGDAHHVTDATELSRGVVFPTRPQSSYRIDYTLYDEQPGRTIRGAALIVLKGANTIWVFVTAWEEEWASIQDQVDDIFLRVSIPL